MEFYQYYDQEKFLKFVPKIRQNVHDWGVVEVSLTGQTSHSAPYIVRQVKNYFSDRDGIIFICSNTQILVIVNMAGSAGFYSLSQGLNEKLPQYSCDVKAANLTSDGLRKLQIMLQDMEQKQRAQPAANPLLAERLERKEKVILVVEDDMYIRELLGKPFQSKGKVVRLDDAENIVETYLQILPDIVFLDIHLPGGSGLDCLAEILSFDDSAYIVIVSIDTAKENIFAAQKLGAKGFVAKPFTPEKLMAVYNKCPTLSFKVQE
jgi:two-component system, chemotaxis family, chemotaxis protein CheY